METHTDGIWVAEPREIATVKQLTEHIADCGYKADIPDSDNFGYPKTFTRGTTTLASRMVDLVEDADIMVTDNHPLVPPAGKLISALPEFWCQWRFTPEYIDRPATIGYNCFMARERGDRDRTLDILRQKNLLSSGLVSYLARGYDTVNDHGTLEQCIIDTNVSLVLETYIRNDTIVFSEKIFRALQMPRPWLLYCSQRSIELLKQYGFDVLDDYVDISYDTIEIDWNRLDALIDQLETFINKQYTHSDYERFKQAAEHNQNLLEQYEKGWPLKLAEIKQRIRIA